MLTQECIDALCTPEPKADQPKPDWEGFGKAIMEEWQEHHDIEADHRFALALQFHLLLPVRGGFNPLVDIDAHGDAELGDPWYIQNFSRENSKG